MINHAMDAEYAKAKADVLTTAATNARLNTRETAAEHLRAIKHYGEVGLRRLGCSAPKWPDAK